MRSGEFDDEDDDEKPGRLPEQCVRGDESGAGHQLVSGDLGVVSTENGALFITWTNKSRTWIVRCKWPDVNTCRSSRRTPSWHVARKANKELEEMEAAFMTMKSAEQRCWRRRRMKTHTGCILETYKCNTQTPAPAQGKCPSPQGRGSLLDDVCIIVYGT